MDSNVREYNNTHSWFELVFNPEKLSISFRDSLNQEVLWFFDVYQQNLNISWDLGVIAAILARKTHISSSCHYDSSMSDSGEQSLSRRKIAPVMYACPLGLQLAAQLQISRTIVVKRLAELLTLRSTKDDARSGLHLMLEVTASGWLNCWLMPDVVDAWQQNMVQIIQSQAPAQQPDNLGQQKFEKQHADLLFSVQYVHARCCNLLNLGAEAKLINLSESWRLAGSSWSIDFPESASWLDQYGVLRINSPYEYHILRQLLALTDRWNAEPKARDWLKIAGALSSALLDWQRNCRVLGAVAQTKPQLAIARLYLVALVQYWLQRILWEKLEVAAPRTL